MVRIGLPENADEIMFQIEILYDFMDDDVKDRDSFVIKRISENFKLTEQEAARYVEEYKKAIQKGDN
ncbi:MAG: hypothetical protein QXG05_04575 [Nitrososphaerota archaeon]